MKGKFNRVYLSGNDYYETSDSAKDCTVEGSGNNSTIMLNGNNEHVYIHRNNATITVNNTASNIQGYANTVLDVTVNGLVGDLILGNGDNNEIKSGNGNYDITSTGNSNKIDCTTGDAYIEVTQDSKDVIINGHDSTVTVLTKGENTTLISCDKLIKQVDSRNIQAGIKGDSSSQIEIDTGFLTGRLTFDVSNSAHTAKSIENVDNLIEEVTQKLTEIGAQYQRLGSALEENETKQINLMSSKSTLQDADVAELTSEYVRNLIIQQSSSILSVTTTNLNMQMVQSLLPKIG